MLIKFQTFFCKNIFYLTIEKFLITIMLFIAVINDDYQIKISAFKKLRKASLLMIFLFFASIIFAFTVAYLLLIYLFSQISPGVSGSETMNAFLSPLLTNIYFIIIIAIFSILLAFFEIYAIYLYSRSLLLLSKLSNELKGPAKFSKYLYIVLILVDAFAGIYIRYNMLGTGNLIVLYIYISVIIIEFVMVLILFIGIYRIGVIYKSSSLRLGSIFYFLPFVDIAAPFLLYSGSGQLLSILNESKMDNNSS